MVCQSVSVILVTQGVWVDDLLTVPAEEKSKTRLAMLELSLLEGSFPPESFPAFWTWWGSEDMHILIDLSSLLTKCLHSSAHTVSSGTGDTFRGRFLFLLVANRSNIGKSQILRILWTMDGWRDHSDERIWFCLDRESAITFLVLEDSLLWETIVFSWEDGTAGMFLPFVCPIWFLPVCCFKQLQWNCLNWQESQSLGEGWTVQEHIPDGSHLQDIDVKGLFLLGSWTINFALVHMGTPSIHGGIWTDSVLVGGFVNFTLHEETGLLL